MTLTRPPCTSTTQHAWIGPRNQLHLRPPPAFDPTLYVVLQAPQARHTALPSAAYQLERSWAGLQEAQQCRSVQEGVPSHLATSMLESTRRSHKEQVRLHSSWVPYHPLRTRLAAAAAAAGGGTSASAVAAGAPSHYEVRGAGKGRACMGPGWLGSFLVVWQPRLLPRANSQGSMHWMPCVLVAECCIRDREVR